MSKWRINLILIILVLFGAAIVSRLVSIQVINKELYRALAKGQQSSLGVLRGDRGEIFFKGGEILAANFKIQQEPEVSPDNIQESALRHYPRGEMASQTIGFLGGEQIGQYGIEGYYDEILRGKEILLRSEDSQSGKSADTTRRENKGEDVFLTLDYNIQFASENLLQKAAKDLNIEGGQIIVIDPSNGAILALANFPNFDPNRYFETENFDVFQNGAAQKFFEPGSVLKPITMASAIEEGKITPDTTYVDPGIVKIGGSKIENYGERVWGKLSMTEVLEKSVNTGAVFAQRQLGNEKFLEYLEKFGFFEPTGVDLQGEVFSENRELKKGYEINFATASFGQGIEITPIQLIRAFSAIANGGRMARPHLAEISPEFSGEVISPKTASQVVAMMVSVVENGFAKEARIPGYYVAGKTGTGQIPWSSLGIGRKGYSDKTWQSFIGFAPAFNPRFLILVKLDNPESKTAEYSAVPIFKELAKYLLDYLQVPPDYQQ